MSSQNRSQSDTSALADAAAALPNGGSPLPDIASSGQPRADQFQLLADAGYRTVIDLRPPAESRGFDEAAAARAAGLAYENIPVTAQTLGDAEFDSLRALLKNPEARPAVVHCASANRVGALLIPYLMLDEGRTSSEATEIAVRAGLRSQELLTAALRYAKARGAPGL